MSIFDDKSMKKSSGKSGIKSTSYKNGMKEEYSSDIMGSFSSKESAGGLSGKESSKYEFSKDLDTDTTGRLSNNTATASHKVQDNTNQTAATTGAATGTTAAGTTAAGTTAGGMGLSGKSMNTEVASDMMGSNIHQFGTQSYSNAGVSFHKISDREAKINYTGLLQQSGANNLTGVYGYGSNQNWENVSSVTFTKDTGGNFSATVPIQNGKNVNFAFKDAAENWDNNSGLNYTFVN